MDPSIMKLLEEDEDETMHSGADVEAFTAALNRDIEGDASSSHPVDTDPTTVPQGKSQNLFSQWQPSRQDGNNNMQELQNRSQKDLNHIEQTEHQPSDMDVRQHAPCGDSQSQDVNTSSQSSNEHPLEHNQSRQNRQEQSSMMLSQSSGSYHMREPSRMHNPSSDTQFHKDLPAGQQQAALELSNHPAARGRGQIPFGILLPLILSELDKDKAAQLETLYERLKKNEIPKEVFVKHMRGLVGDQMLRLAVVKMQAKAARNSQMAHSQFRKMQSEAPAQQPHLRQPSCSAAQYSDPHSFALLHRRSLNAAAETSASHPLTTEVHKDSVQQTVDNNTKKSADLEHVTESCGMQVTQIVERPTITIQGLTKQQQQHLHFSQSSFPMYGSGNPYSGSNVSTSAATVKPQPLDPQMRQQIHACFGSAPVGGTTQTMNVMSIPKFERQNTFIEAQRIPGGSVSQIPHSSTTQQNLVPWQPSMGKEQKACAQSSMPYLKQEPVHQTNEQQQKTPFSSSHGHESASVSVSPLEQGNLAHAFPTATCAQPKSVSPSVTAPMDAEFQQSQPTSAAPVGDAKAPPKKLSASQKKLLDTHGSSPPLPQKKQKASGTFLDQSIEHLNDVTAVSGVNLREEEEQLFSGSKEESRALEASRRVVQEEEDRVILQKNPLQRKLAEIMTKCGLKNSSSDVELCLSLCVEQRLRGLICNLIRISKQRVDSERTRHHTVVTSDVRRQIMLINREAREEWDKKQAEAEKFRKVNEEPDDAAGVDGDKERDEPRGKSLKVNKEEDDKMRTTAANVAARAAVGGDDMLSKWQLMAEQARQKREGASEANSASLPGKDVSHKPLLNPMRNSRDNQAGRKDQSAAGAVSSRQLGRSLGGAATSRPARSLTVNDVIAVLEREPQMTKSNTLYRLYEKVRTATDRVKAE